MKTLRAEENAVTLLLAGGEAAGPDTVLALVRRARAEAGLAPWEDIRAECFARRGEVLVIARRGGRRRAWYFPDRETLLACAAAIPAEGGAVYAAGEGYLWLLPAAEAFPGLAEFGEERRLHPLWEVHAREQGRCLLPEAAGKRLREDLRQD